MNLTSAIIDDEPLARARLRRLLSELSIDVIAEGQNGIEAVEIAEAQQPDLMFLDIQMPKLDGLSAAKKINHLNDRPPAIIFSTAYDNYAIEAFKTNAAAYILKPYLREDIETAIERCHSLNKVQSSTLEQSSNEKTYIAISSGTNIEKIESGEIVFFSAKEKHTFATLTSGREVLVDISLKAIETEYQKFFLRINRSQAAHKDQISKLERSDGSYHIELFYQKTRLTVSRRKLSAVKAQIKAH